MGGSSTQDTQQTTAQSTQLPAWVLQAGRSNYGVAKGIAAQAYDPARNVSVAGTTDATNQGYGLINSSVGAAQPIINNATAAYGAGTGYAAPTVNATGVTAGQLANTNLQPYMNPYTQSVIDASMASGNQARQQAIAGNDAAATAAHAFGGSRGAIADGVTNSQYALGAANTAASLNQANFAQAQAAAGTDISNKLAADTTTAGQNLSASEANASNANTAASLRQGAASGLLSSASALTAANQNDITNKLAEGTAQQAQNQNVLNANTQNAQQQYQDKVDKLNLLLSSLGMTPYNTSTIGSSSGTTQTSATPDLATAGLGLGKLLFPTGASGISSLLSDDTMKVDKTKIGQIPGTGLGIHAFRYKGDPKTYPKSVGLMASEVEKHMPAAVSTMPGGKKVVNYGMLGAPGMEPQQHKVHNLPKGTRKAPDGQHYAPDPARPGKYLHIRL